MDFKKYINTHQVVGLSPLDGYTDEAFRLVISEISPPDVYFTEFVSAEGLSGGGVKLYDTLLYSATERPIVGQLFGKNPDSFYKSAIILCHLGFNGIDINMGCPAKTVTQHGSGAALIGKPDLVTEIINAVKSGIDDWYQQKVTVNDLKLNQKTLEIINRNIKYCILPLPVKGGVRGGFCPTISVKTRIGITESIIGEWLSHLLKHKLDFITVHGRTLKQGYAGQADWNEIQKAVNLAKGSNILIWGNGDINSRQQGSDYCRIYGVNGVLIGRSALGNPWVFSNHIANDREKFKIMINHANHFLRVFPHRRFDCLRKNFLLYTSGLPNAKQLRQKLIRINSLTELYGLEDEFISC